MQPHFWGLPTTPPSRDGATIHRHYDSVKCLPTGLYRPPTPPAGPLAALVLRDRSPPVDAATTGASALRMRPEDRHVLQIRLHAPSEKARKIISGPSDPHF